MLKKKLVIIAVMTTLLFGGVVGASSINGDFNGNPIVKVKSNGQALPVEDTPAVIYEGRTLVPIYMLKQLGVEVKWDQDSYSVEVALPSKNESKTISNNVTVDEISRKLGKNGENIVDYVEYMSNGEGFSQISFNLKFNASDTTKGNDYNKVIDYGVLSGAYQIRLYDTSDYITFIKTKDIIDFKENKITSDDFIKRMEIVPKQSTNLSNTAPTNNAPTKKISTPLVYSNDGKTYLGKMTSNTFDKDSIFNEFGTYGSEFSSSSIWNEFGTYGSEFSNESAFNKLATKPPVVMADGEIIGYLTTNTTISKAISPIGLKEKLEKMGL